MVQAVVVQMTAKASLRAAPRRPKAAASLARGSCALKRHVQRLRLLVGVLDLELGQRRAAVEAPVHRLQAAVDEAALDHALEGADLAGLVDEVHRAVGMVPVAQHAQALEVGHLHADLLGGEGAALGLHLVAAAGCGRTSSRSRSRSAGRGSPSPGM